VLQYKRWCDGWVHATFKSPGDGTLRKKSRLLSACAPCRNILYLTRRHRAEHRRCERKTVRASAYIYGNRSNRPRWWWWLRRRRRRRGIKGCDSVFGEKLSRTIRDVVTTTAATSNPDTTPSPHTSRRQATHCR